MDNSCMGRCSDSDTFSDTGIPTSAVKQAFAKGSPQWLLEKALEVLDPIAAEVIGSIKTIKQAEKVYNMSMNMRESKEKRDAILIKWIILCETREELAKPMMRSPSQSLAEAAALQKTVKFKFA